MERLLERDEELFALTGIVDGVRVGRGGVVLVGGEAGAGKTSLVRTLRARAGDLVPILVGGCEPLSVPVPLAPIRELLAASGCELAAVGDDDRLGLAERPLARRPAVVVVEDAHWADPLPLDVVRILARRAERAGVGLVVTYRDDEVAANTELGLLLGDLATRPEVSRITLARCRSRRSVCCPAQAVSTRAPSPALPVATRSSSSSRSPLAGGCLPQSATRRLPGLAG